MALCRCLVWSKLLEETALVGLALYELRRLQQPQPQQSASASARLANPLAVWVLSLRWHSWRWHAQPV